MLSHPHYPPSLFVGEELAPPVASTLSISTTFSKAHPSLRPAPPHLPPLSKVRCCRPKKFGRLPEGLPHQPFAPHQPFKNRTIPPTFRRVSVCVCLYGFASVQNSGHTRLRHPCLFMNALLALRPAKPLGVHFRHPCLACPSRCTQPFHPHNHCKRTIIPLPCTITLAF